MVIKDCKFFGSLKEILRECKNLQEFDFGPEFSEMENWNNLYVYKEDIDLIDSLNANIQVLKIFSCDVVEFYQVISEKLKNLKILQFYVKKKKNFAFNFNFLKDQSKVCYL